MSNEAQQSSEKRFRIKWDGSQYRVNIHNYAGGEVVRASEYDRLHKALRRIASIAPTPEAKYAKKNPGYACALDLGEIAREALDHE